MLKRIRRFFRSIRYGLRNLRRYFRVVWRDHDWDWVFIVALLRVKFEKMLDFYSDASNYSHLNVDDIKEDLKEAIRLCVGLENGLCYFEEDKVVQDLFDLMKRKMQYWWD